MPICVQHMQGDAQQANRGRLGTSFSLLARSVV